MSCYIRHLEEVLDSLGLEKTKEGRALLDQKIRKLLNAESWHCPEIWSEVKKRIDTPEHFEDFIKDLQKVSLD